jgi:hypothetical protein
MPSFVFGLTHLNKEMTIIMLISAFNTINNSTFATCFYGYIAYDESYLEYSSKTTLYTGLASGSSIEMGHSIIKLQIQLLIT